MRTTRIELAALCMLVFALGAPPIQAQTIAASGADGSARVIVKFKADSPLLRAQVLSATASQVSRAQALGARLGLTMSAGAAVSERTQVVYATGMTSEELAQRLAAEADVEYAVPDGRKRHFVAPNDPLYAAGAGGNGPAVGQWYLRAPSSAVPSSLNVETAWAITTGSPSVVVAMIDTGVRFDHPDLLAVAAGGNLLPGYDMISDVNIANDGNGRDPDASDPGDWVTQAEAAKVGGPFYQCPVENSSWHGTQTSGLVAALTNNGLGMASVGRNVRLLPVRVLGKCGGNDSDIIAGMLWAAGLSVPGVPANPNPARVINMSLGGAGPCTAAYQDAVNQIIAVGTVIVASAGNSGNAVAAPANCAGVIAVVALRQAGTKVGFSSLGPEVAISAPGGNCVNTAPGSPCLYPILTTSNSGTTTPANPIYTDSFNPSLGTSFSAPLVAGTVALMLSAQPTLTPYQMRVLLQATARPFPTTGGDNGDGTSVLQCTAPQSDGFGNPIAQLQCYCTTDTCGAGVQAGGLWWAAPAASESGWGINFAHQGSTIFATWFTYDTTGKAWWLSMTANKTASGPDTYAGQLYATLGPAFSAVPFNPSAVVHTIVGLATLTLSDLNRGSFSYVVNGLAQSKALTRQTFGPPPSCTYGPAPDFASATNYQDLWWVAAGAEAGWGINLTQQGNSIFATWFTYDVDGTPLWLSMTAANTGPGVYSGPLIRTTGPPFSAVPFHPALVTRAVVGTATLTFANGNAATFVYTVNNVAQTKQLTRQLFAPPAGTVCH